ncbi:DUF192 domain-containing protein [Thermodesulfobacteriota bacterium]
MKINYYLYCVLFLVLFSCSSNNKPKEPTIHIGNTSLEVEIADTPEKQQQGLMKRTFLEENHGMLFVFDKEQHINFWMKDTGIPLTIAFIKKSGQITEIYDLEPYSLKMVWSSHPVMYALEVNRGYFKKNDIKVGDSVKIP